MVIHGDLLLQRQTQQSPSPYPDESNAGALLAIHGTLCGVSLVVVALRLLVRAFMLKSVGSDDWVMAVAQVLEIGVFVTYIGESIVGGLGRHIPNVAPEALSKFFHWRYFHSLIIMVGISLVKISIALFLRRFVPNKNYQRFLLGAIAFLVAFTISCAGTLIFNCGLDVAANWDFALAAQPGVKCFSSATFTNIGLFNSSVNIATDVLFALLPIPIVLKLQVNRRTKITLICVLGLGIFACIASIVKTVIQSTVLQDPDWIFHDSFFMWNNIEYTIGIIAASLPSLRPLFAKFLGLTARLTSNRSKSGPGVGYDGDGLAYRKGDTKRSSRVQRQYYKFDSAHSGVNSAIEMDQIRRGASTRVYRDEDRVSGVTSSVVARMSDDTGDKAILDPGTSTTERFTDHKGGITKTTTVQITRY